MAYESGWTPIVELQTGQQVSDKLDTTFGNIDTGLAGLTSDLASIDTKLVLHGVVNPNTNILSLNIDTTKYEVVPLTYYIQGVKYTFSASVISAAFVASGDFKVIGLDASGIVTRTNTFFTPTELKTIVEIGRIATDNGTTITSIGDSAFFTNEFMQNVYIRFKAFEGTAFADGAGLVSEYLTDQLSVQGGLISDPNLNIESIISVDGIDAFPVYNIGGVSGIRTAQSPLVVTNTQYDDGTSLANIPNNKYVAHTLFRSSGTGKYYLEYGRIIYDSLVQAQLGAIENNYFSDAGSEVEPLARIIVMEGTGIESILDVRGKKSSDSSDNVSVLGWKDNIAPFSTAQGNGTTEPVWEDIGNGNYAMNFTTGDELFVQFHVDHDYALGTKAYPHVHFICQQAQTAGTTVTWEFAYRIAKGHSQGDSLITAPRTTILLTYTYDGTEVAGEHIVVECSDLDAFDLIEPDTVIMAGVTLLSETASGKIYGLMADLHYQSDRETTPFKSPNFLTGV
mgnify:CR=1 FL=1